MHAALEDIAEALVQGAADHRIDSARRTQCGLVGFDLGLDIAAAEGITVEEFKKIAMSRVPLGEMVQPGEVADLVAFLSADTGNKITGQAISICAGSTQA